MRTIKIGNDEYKFYQSGFGYPQHIYYYPPTKEAVGVPKGSQTPSEVLLQAVNSGSQSEPRYVEITDADIGQKAIRRFKQ